MIEADLAKKLLARLRQVPNVNVTPAKLLAEFRRLLAAEGAKTHRHKAPTN